MAHVAAYLVFVIDGDYPVVTTPTCRAACVAASRQCWHRPRSQHRIPSKRELGA